MRNILLLAVAALLALLGAPARAQTADLVLTGVITRADNESYVEVPFRTPRGLHAITIAFEYTTRDQHTTIDLGVMDPDGLRGWSGGNKSTVVIGEVSATPSYRAGPIQSGRWRLLLGVPNIREGVAATYTARITFHRDDEPSFAAAPLIEEARWYRGDLHAHTAHSDGACASQSGARVPCPLTRTLDAAVARGLDFIAISDHNTTSQFNELRGLQPYYDRLLLLPGREITTFQGHANVFGVIRPIDFRVTRGRAMNDLFASLGGAFISINHPAAPSGEACLGCAWTAPDTDYARVAAIEVTNGGLAAALTQSAEGPFSGLAFWRARLNEGHRLTAIGGSDNHDASISLERFPAIGRPTTVVFARNLSQAALLEGLRSGRVFVDVDGSRDRVLDMSARARDAAADMGGTLAAPTGVAVRFVVRVHGVINPHIEIYRDGALLGPPLTTETEGDDIIGDFSVEGDGARHWFAPQVRDASGRLVLIGNPIYVNWPGR